jgi:hypothetical protein
VLGRLAITRAGLFTTRVRGVLGGARAPHFNLGNLGREGTSLACIKRHVIGTHVLACCPSIRVPLAIPLLKARLSTLLKQAFINTMHCKQEALGVI